MTDFVLPATSTSAPNRSTVAEPAPRPAPAARYEVRPTDARQVEQLARECGVGPVTAEFLALRGMDAATAADFLDPKLSQLSSPAAMIDRMAAARRIAEAIRQGERIAIFGDYDVDGTTSAAILADVIEKLGGEVFAFVANRFEGGYGFSERALARVRGCDPHLIITCDCGSADHDRVQTARDAGIDVVVVDHHLVPERPLPAVAFLNPHRPDCGFPFKGMCSAGLAFSLGAALRTELGVDLDLRPWLDLVALGTIADVAPLEADNRILTRAGLRLLGAERARPGVQALRECARVKTGRPLSAWEIAFRLAPRLNAAGRLGDPTITLELLRAKDLAKARELARAIEALNDERKAVERRCTEEAIEAVELRYGRQPKGGVVVASEGWHRGVVGITAARLVDRFDVPAIVIAVDETGVGHGSARTPEGVHVHAAITACADAEPGLLTRFGGHAAAAGVTLPADHVPRFAELFAEAAPRPEANTAPPTVDIEITAGVPLPHPDELMRLEPLGEGNRPPLFALRDVLVDDVRLVGDGAHLKLTLRHDDGRRVGVFGAGMAHRIDDIRERVTVIGTLRPDTWRGGDALELSLERLYTD